MYKAGIITLSDSGYQGLREDESGRIIKHLIQDQFEIVGQKILPDEAVKLKALLIEWCLTCDLILTTGGTGLGVRDITPEATLSVAEKEIPGISEGMRMLSIQKTPFAMLSRGVAVQRERTLIINLPGSPKGVTENLTYLLPILPHALDILTDRKTEH
ncbi:MogA/MoaB family molybdenum cofactor biosynthesis protein [Candidatus Enterococcus ikei]|uniref:MogA/MoaB family molybdenum cofactor biosynthesis protein n=1 Tax=Candidatus Enterococcus ikei TaxID=2815326 RepID=A0ABS3H2K8_9ENTE|nr:MogA/MoaB family molybdenum cofactor biosynthesis protein [Enterococcus sp. DIV0869a]MBO0441746.1 MogA/MoaB family molybdenum cofactor biosynthesis protein [Enterococcus sp. DIV0869a]